MTLFTRKNLYLFALCTAFNSDVVAVELSDNLYWNTHIDIEHYSVSYLNSEDANKHEDEFLPELTSFYTGLDYSTEYFSTHFYLDYRDRVIKEIENNEDVKGDPEISQAQVYLKPGGDFFMGVGRSYLPFGYQGSLAITYAPVVSFGYTVEDNIQAGWQNTWSFGALYAYKSELIHTETENTETGYGADLSFSIKEDLITFGASYLSNMADTDLFELVFDDLEEVDTIVPARAYYLSFYLKGFQLIAESMSATDYFGEGDIYGYLSDKKPKFSNYEMGYTTDSGLTIMIGQRGTKDAEFTGMIKSANLLGMSISLYKNRLVLGAEIQSGEYYPDLESEEEQYHRYNQVTTQLVLNF